MEGQGIMVIVYLMLSIDICTNTSRQPRSQGLRGETVTKTLVKFVLSFQNFGEKIACAVRHNRIAITVESTEKAGPLIVSLYVIFRFFQQKNSLASYTYMGKICHNEFTDLS